MMLMFELDDWDAIPDSAPLPEPLTVELNAPRLQGLKHIGIATTFSSEAHERDEGWLNQQDRYVFSNSFTIEGPSAFYGGPFSPNIWTGAGGLCAMGACSYSHSPVPEGMRIGRYCSIGRELKFLDFAHPTQWLSSSVAFFRPTGVKQLSTVRSLIEREGELNDPGFERRTFDPRLGLSYPQIGHDVWIGERVTLALGIRVGTGAVIAAGSIVTRDVPPYAVVAGSPARIKRLRFEEKLIERLLASRWWHYGFTDLNTLEITQPERLLEQLNSAISQGKISTWQPEKICLPFDLLNKE